MQERSQHHRLWDQNRVLWDHKLSENEICCDGHRIIREGFEGGTTQQGGREQNQGLKAVAHYSTSGREWDASDWQQQKCPTDQRYKRNIVSEIRSLARIRPARILYYYTRVLDCSDLLYIGGFASEQQNLFKLRMYLPKDHPEDRYQRSFLQTFNMFRFFLIFCR